MPIHLPPINRRRFLAGSLAAGAGLLSVRDIFAAEASADPHSIALLADTHIPTDAAQDHSGINMADHLRRVVGELTALKTRPAGAMVVGDCAFGNGQPGDYRLLDQLLKPLGAAGWPVHLALGNHDNRDTFHEILANERQAHPPVVGKHVSIVETERANWFLLDSLMKVNVVTGQLGQAQLAWLARALDEHANKPAIIVAHHPAQWETAKLADGDIHGLKDTEALFEIMQPRKQVKAFVFGHTHHWQVTEREGIHLINLPPVAYLFNPTDPSGWVHAQLKPDGLTLTLHSLDKQHRAEGETHSLAWRAG